MTIARQWEQPESSSTLRQAEFDQIETLISTRGIDNVLLAISELCGTLGQHGSASSRARWYALCGNLGLVANQGRNLR